MDVIWTFVWVTEWAEIWSEAFQARWLLLFHESHVPNAFYHPMFVRAWLEKGERMNEFCPRFLIGKTSNGSEALIPFISSRSNKNELGLKRLFPVGQSDFDFHDPLVRIREENTSGVYHALFADMHREMMRGKPYVWDRVELPRLRGIVEDQSYFEDVQICSKAQLTKFNCYDEYFVSLSKKQRYDIRRNLKLLDEMGSLKFEVCQSDQTETGLCWVRELCSAREEKYGETSLTLEVLEGIVKTCLGSGMLHLSRLSLDGRSIAWHMGLLDRDTLHWYAPSYDLQLAQYSPGKVLIALCVEWCYANGCGSIDFLRGDEHYKSRWVNEEQEIRNFTLRNHHLWSVFRRSRAKFLVEMRMKKARDQRLSV
jgi:CelD/BcsL family acetyltransferase involved in cellulose biosynthesis